MWMGALLPYHRLIKIRDDSENLRQLLTNGPLRRNPVDDDFRVAVLPIAHLRPEVENNLYVVQKLKMALNKASILKHATKVFRLTLFGV